MRKLIATLAAVFAVLGIGGYAAGLFTQDGVQRDSCRICRAMRYTGTRYGFRYNKFEDTALSTWYRKTIDPQHGLSAGHEHVWERSACPVYAAPGVGDIEAACPTVAPVFFLKPETELVALRDVPDNRTRQAIIESINVPDRHLSTERVKLLVEYVYLYRTNTPWKVWWEKNGAAFGIRPAGRK